MFEQLIIVSVLWFLIGITTKLTDIISDNSTKIINKFRKYSFFLGIIYGLLISIAILLFPEIIPFALGVIIALILTKKIDSKGHIIGVLIFLVFISFYYFLFGGELINLISLIILFFLGSIIDEVSSDLVDKKRINNKLLSKIILLRPFLEIITFSYSFLIGQWIFFITIFSYDIAYNITSKFESYLLNNRIKFYGVPLSDGALGKNDGAKEAPKYLSKLFNKKGNIFELNGSFEEKQKQIIEKSNNIFDAEKVVIFGGTHDITNFTFKAFNENFNDSKLLIFDAHADCEDDIKGVISHEDFVKNLIDEKILNSENLLIVGLRDVSKFERNYLKKNKINHIYFDDEEFYENSKVLVSDFTKRGELYVSFDVDFLNERIMRATGYHPKKGASVKQAKELLSICFDKAKALDIVELNPLKVKKEDKILKEIFDEFFNLV
jgi:arginase family enzyme